MSVLVQKEAPDFQAKAVMPDGSFKDVSLREYRGKYVVLFFYPLDFTFVCPTEIIAFSEAAAQFQALNVQLLGCSIDSHYTHLAWRNTPRNHGGLGEIKYPLIADLDKDRRSIWCTSSGGNRFTRIVLHRQGRHRSPRSRQRPAVGPQRRRGVKDRESVAVRRGARRGLPRQLAARRGHHEARSEGKPRVLLQAVQIVPEV